MSNPVTSFPSYPFFTIGLVLEKYNAYAVSNTLKKFVLHKIDLSDLLWNFFGLGFIDYFKIILNKLKSLKVQNIWKIKYAEKQC